MQSLSNRDVAQKLNHIHDHLIKISDQLDAVLNRQAVNQEQIMSALTDALDLAEANAAQNDQADTAAEGLLVQLTQMIKDLATNGTDPATVTRINALAAAIGARAAQLGVAVAANTPAAPPAP